ncbi:Y-family DNA polymerase [Ferruginibacter lapsinanis]|uniref:Y-family DNA polymerase n=1 Tax=Ferruginibacter lapsinanis TaxID=563172 RepID=UPI001E4052B4|nr:Y-family DNA polymerase [Ferruginibacter lapsinanis]UEG50537.1 Y-family DNA polymerase [Ferruginibacter lapsinanis]
MKAIIDCNSFYCSCERLFKPHLDDQPVVVLSNNDGCIISRSDEAKKLGVEMAGPYFKAKPLIEKYGVATFSSNYNLYGDLSWRVMETLRVILGKENVEVYSVDEAFLNLDEFEGHDLYKVGVDIKDTVEQWTGIKVSVGVAPTKVLSKVANHLAKKNKIATNCVVVLDSKEKINEALMATPVREVWGVGHQSAQKLTEMNAVFTAYDLTKKTEEWARKYLGGVVGVRLLKELKGEVAKDMEKELTVKKMIATTRMFGSAVNSIEDIKEAVATYTSKAAEKLRRQNSAAGTISVFVVAKNEDHNVSFNRGVTSSSYITLPIATSATNDLIKPAVKLVDQLFKKGTWYKKAGVMLSGLVPDETIQGNLFEEQKNNNRSLMSMVDNVNFAMRNDMIKFAASGTKRDWKMRMEMRSPRYTTRWEELFVVK